MTLTDRLKARADNGPLDLCGIVLALSRIPYGRPSRLTPEAVIDDWRGTCSTKHLLLCALVTEGWPQYQVDLWHRVYRLARREAAEHWGAHVAATVPAGGLVDVHTYAVVSTGERDVRVDATFPIDAWDGLSDLPLACGDGEDVPAGHDPMATKRRLVAHRCDPEIREPFIAALASAWGTGPA